jgi:hypothetical protein
MNSRIVFCALASAVTFAACAASETPEQLQAKVQQVTAQALGGDVRPEAVLIANFERKSAAASWHAVVADVAYLCTSDEQLNLPDCVKQQ